MRISNILFGVILFGATAHAAETFHATLDTAVDGDSFFLRHESGGNVEVRLSGVDTPEHGQPYADAARDFTKSFLYGNRVTVEVVDYDRYRRAVVHIRRASDGKNLERALVGAGLAWWYERYSTDATLGAIQKKARKARLGLWKDKSPVAPWDFRQDKRSSVSPVGRQGQTLSTEVSMSYASQTTDAEEEPRECCKVCSKGKACGNSCIARSKTCHKSGGCACDAQ